jgi:hypothetical protein
MKAKALILAAVLASIAMGAPVTLTMNEVANQAINGLAVTKGGITFSFTASDPSLMYNVVTGAPAETFVQDPTIEGNNGTVTIVFSVPVSTVQFGMLVNSSAAVATMATVSLYNNSATPFATFPLGSSLIDPFAEGQFTYNGSQGPVTRITITPTGSSFSVMALDNLTVVSAPVIPPPASGVPAASPLALAITAILLVGLTMFLLRNQPA